MAKLTDELRAEHEVIARALAEATELGAGSEASRAKLLGAQGSLLNHIAREDGELYPALWAAAEADPELHDTLDAFASDMLATSRAVLAFFTKYSSADSDPVQFAVDYGVLLGKLTTRIRWEEDVLYAKFDELGA